MPKELSVFVCQQCGYQNPQYLGRCPQCATWNSFVEQIEREAQISNVKFQVSKVINLAKIERSHFPRLKTDIEEFDRVLGGGIVPGSLILVAGDPGIGKSTLLTHIALNVARGDSEEGFPARSRSEREPSEDARFAKRARRETELDFDGELSRTAGPRATSPLYVAGEESAQQIKIRADRIKPKANLSILNETDVDVILAVIEDLKPSLVIVDSIQTLETTDLESAAGSVGQVRECAHRLQKMAKAKHIPILLVGHVTKEGVVAGPKTLEHLVDVVLSLEGDPTSNFRILRGSKNRFGATDEVGVFEMQDQGMMEVKNPSKLFLETRLNVPGSAVVPVITGLRPMLVEIQALVTKTSLPVPRRVAAGVDNNRLQLLVAVLQKRLGLPLFDQDIFVNVTGGLRVIEPASDLGVCMAIISSFKDKVIAPKTAFVGEVGLLGEIRQVRGIDKRILEAKKLGFIKIISPEKEKTLAWSVKVAL